MYTTSTAFLEALQEAGVSYLFVNFGSDHSAMIESLADAKKNNKELPEVIICPHEMVALSAAHGYAQITGKPQAVIVHVECGTQNLGGAIHNAAKGRVPVLIFAGASPFTQEGELTGSRNEFIHWIQDVSDQRGIVRGYTKYDNEIRTGKNVKQLVHRSLQFANSEPKGPVYLMGAREVMEEEVTNKVTIDPALWEPIMPAAMPPKSVDEVVKDLLKAKKPLIITSYLGRNTEAVTELVALCERLSIPVIESCPNYVNFPADHPMHCGYQWNTPGQNELIDEADLILVFDSDVPWITMKNNPSKDATIYYFDVDPIKEEMPLWYIPSKRFFKVDSQIALQQINQEINKKRKFDVELIESRWKTYSKYHEEQREALSLLEEERTDYITPEFLTACVREVMDENTIIISEGISNYPTISNHIQANRKASLFGSGAGSLGWNGGASIGAKLAEPDKTIISLTGDGAYFFSVPSTVHWMANRYETAFLTVIYNNHGWKSPKLSTLGVHPEGVAQQTDEFWVDFNPVSDLSKIAEAAGGSFAKSVENPTELKAALAQCLQVVKEGRSAVLDVHLPHVKEMNKSELSPERINVLL